MRDVHRFGGNSLTFSLSQNADLLLKVVIFNFSQDRCYDITGFYLLDGLNDSVLFFLVHFKFLRLDFLLVSLSFSFVTLSPLMLGRFIGALFFALLQTFSEVVASVAISLERSLI